MKINNINFKFSDLEKEFWKSELNNNKKFFILMFALIGCIEIIMLLALFLTNHFKVTPIISYSYCPFYITGIILSIVFILLVHFLKKPGRFLQVISLSVLMLWACFFTIHDLKNGYPSYVLAQVLVLTSYSVMAEKRGDTAERNF